MAVYKHWKKLKFIRASKNPLTCWKCLLVLLVWEELLA